jgi:hypothetical protein
MKELIKDNHKLRKLEEKQKTTDAKVQKLFIRVFVRISLLKSICRCN